MPIVRQVNNLNGSVPLETGSSSIDPNGSDPGGASNSTTYTPSSYLLPSGTIERIHLSNTQKALQDLDKVSKVLYTGREGKYQLRMVENTENPEDPYLFIIELFTTTDSTNAGFYHFIEELKDEIPRGGDFVFLRDLDLGEISQMGLSDTNESRLSSALVRASDISLSGFNTYSKSMEAIYTSLLRMTISYLELKTSMKFPDFLNRVINDINSETRAKRSSRKLITPPKDILTALTLLEVLYKEESTLKIVRKYYTDGDNNKKYSLLLNNIKNKTDKQKVSYENLKSAIEDYTYYCSTYIGSATSYSTVDEESGMRLTGHNYTFTDNLNHLINSSKTINQTSFLDKLNTYLTDNRIDSNDCNLPTLKYLYQHINKIIPPNTIDACTSTCKELLKYSNYLRRELDYFERGDYNSKAVEEELKRNNMSSKFSKILTEPLDREDHHFVLQMEPPLAMKIILGLAPFEIKADLFDHMNPIIDARKSRFRSPYLKSNERYFGF